MICKPSIRSRAASGEEGFLLVAMIFAVAVILIFLAVAAPTVAKDLQREREVETVHRGNQYVRSIRLYYRKFGHYPTSIDQLVESNNIRFLRKKYVDPMTGKDDWRIIHVGENKTTVTGFFGQPLAGLNTSGGLGSASGMVSNTGGSTTGGTTTGGGSTSDGSQSAFSNPGSGNSSGSSNNSSNSPFSSGSSFGSSSSDSSSSTNTPGGSSPTSTDATKFGGGGGPIMGVSSQSPKTSIISIREKTTYNTWEFIYDPRIEALYKGNPLGGSVGSSNGGNAFGQQNGIGTPATGTTPTNGTGSGPTSTGNGSGSGTGTGSGSGSLWGGSGTN